MNTVLVTGGSRGIGRAMVELFSKAGYKVAFTYNSSSFAAEEVAKKFGALAVKADSRSEAEVVMAVQKAEAELGAIDVLINNAGVSSVGLITDVSLDEWDRVMDTSVTGAFLYSKALLSLAE